MGNTNVNYAGVQRFDLIKVMAIVTMCVDHCLKSQFSITWLPSVKSQKTCNLFSREKDSHEIDLLCSHLIHVVVIRRRHQWPKHAIRQ